MPLALFKPFGYSHHPTQLQVGTFWGWVALLLAAHYLKYRLAKRRADKDAAADGPLERRLEKEGRVEVGPRKINALFAKDLIDASEASVLRIHLDRKQIVAI